MVISQKMNESKMGDRGSKSEILSPQPKRISVKEQRVDGSYFGLNPKLRYTLKDFERNYQIKVLSKQFKQTKNFSSLAQASNTKLNLWFVTDFC